MNQIGQYLQRRKNSLKIIPTGLSWGNKKKKTFNIEYPGS